MDTNLLIDNRNKDLWAEINKVQDIDIHLVDGTIYSVYTKSGKSTIYVPKNKIKPASFTHELLHIYLSTKKVFIGGSLKLSIKGNPNLSRIFSDNLLEHIGNCIEHIKMLPIFLSLGFERKCFLSDYSTNKFTAQELEAVKNHFCKYGLYHSSTIDLFIGKYFATKSCPDNSKDYTNQLKELQSINNELYLILDKFLIAWNNFDYNNDGDYHSFVFDLVNELDNWTIGKLII